MRAAEVLTMGLVTRVVPHDELPAAAEAAAYAVLASGPNARRQLHAWRRSVGAQMPTPNPDYDPAQAGAVPKKAAKKKAAGT